MKHFKKTFLNGYAITINTNRSGGLVIVIAQPDTPTHSDVRLALERYLMEDERMKQKGIKSWADYLKYQDERDGLFEAVKKDNYSVKFLQKVVAEF